MCDPLLELELLGSVRPPNARERELIQKIMLGSIPACPPLEELEIEPQRTVIPNPVWGYDYESE